MTFNLNLKFGQPSLPTSLLSLEVETSSKEVSQHYSFLSREINKYTLPPVVIQMPKSAQPYPLPPIIAESLSDNEFLQETIESEGFFYRLFLHKAPQYVGLVHKLEKLFKPICELDNKLFLHIKLHDVDSFWQKIKEKSQDIFTILFDRAEITGRIDLDKRLIETVGLLLNKISPGFSESPLIAFLELFEELDIAAEFDSPADLKQATRTELTQDLLAIELPDEQEDKEELEKMQGLSQIREPSTIFIHLGKLGFLRIQFETRMLAYLKCMDL